MRRAEESVSGHNTDLAMLQGTRLGLAVVGRLAAKYHISVNYRPSSRGGTGVVVLLPPQLMAQQLGAFHRARRTTENRSADGLSSTNPPASSTSACTPPLSSKYPPR